MKIEVGQKVFIKPINNACRYSNKIKEEVVLKVGKKYFFVGEEGSTERFWTKFNLDDRTQVTNYSPDWKLYFDKQQILDEEEEKKLYGEIKSKFNYYYNSGLTLEQLRQIHWIIFGGLEKGE